MSVALPDPYEPSEGLAPAVTWKTPPDGAPLRQVLDACAARLGLSWQERHGVVSFTRELEPRDRAALLAWVAGDWQPPRRTDGGRSRYSADSFPRNCGDPGGFDAWASAAAPAVPRLRWMADPVIVRAAVLRALDDRDSRRAAFLAGGCLLRWYPTIFLEAQAPGLTYTDWLGRFADDAGLRAAAMARLESALAVHGADPFVLDPAMLAARLCAACGWREACPRLIALARDGGQDHAEGFLTAAARLATAADLDALRRLPEIDADQTVRSSWWRRLLLVGSAAAPPEEIDWSHYAAGWREARWLALAQAGGDAALGDEVARARKDPTRGRRSSSSTRPAAAYPETTACACSPRPAPARNRPRWRRPCARSARAPNRPRKRCWRRPPRACSRTAAPRSTASRLRWPRPCASIPAPRPRPI